MPGTNKQQKGNFHSLSRTLTLAFFGLATLVLILSFSLELYVSYLTQKKDIVSEQALILHSVAHTVSNSIENKLFAMEQASDINDIAESSERRDLVVRKLVDRTPAFRQVRYVAVSGETLALAPGLPTSSTESLPGWHEHMLSTVRSGRYFVSSVHIDHATGAPHVVLAVPARGAFREIQGALVAELDLKFVWDIVAGIRVGKGGLAYVVDKEGVLVAFHDTERVLRRESVAHLKEPSKFVRGIHDTGADTSRGVTGTYVVSGHQALGTPDWAVIVEVPVAEAYAGLLYKAQLTLGIVLIGLLLAILFGIYVSKKITKDIVHLNKVAQAFAGGALDTKIALESNNEIGQLGESFNRMASTLRGLYRGMETKVGELTDEHSRFLASVDSLPIGFIAFDRTQGVVVANKSVGAILNLQKVETISDVAHALGEGFDLMKEYAHLTQKGVPVNVRGIEFGKKFLRIFLSPIMHYLHHDEVIGVVMLVEDITEQVVLERSRDEFFSIASHELRTPLTAIRGNASMLKEFYSDKLFDDDMKAMVSDMLSASERLVHVVNDFLIVSRLEQNRMDFSCVAIDVVGIVKASFADFESMAKSKGIVFRFEEPTSPIPHVMADPDKVKQIVANLVGNAIHFTDSGAVTISIKAHEGGVKVYVEDTGMGVAPKNQPLLFRKFQQAGGSILTRDTTQGTGLGLYICKLMLDHMGGSIALESSEPGRGSTFSFTLPVAPPGGVCPT